MEKILTSDTVSMSKSGSLISIHDLALVLNIDTEALKSSLRDNFNLKIAPSYVPHSLVRAVFENKGYSYPKKIISFQMLKGGVAKTTSALNIGLRASMLGAKVLFVDLDQQANLSYSLGQNEDSVPVWLDIFEKKISIHSAILNVLPNVDLIPSSLNNSVLERAFVNSNRNWSESIRSQLSLVKDNYDLIIIDTAPALSATNTAVTIASDMVILPVNPDKFAILGFEKNLKELREITHDFNLTTDIKVLFTKFDAREKMSEQYLEAFINKFPELLLKSYVRVSSDAKHTLATSKTIFSSKSTAKDDYHLVTTELMNLKMENLCPQ